jgi:hypothetical protein
MSSATNVVRPRHIAVFFAVSEDLMSHVASELIASWNQAVVRSPATLGDVLEGKPTLVRNESVLLKRGLLATIDFGTAPDSAAKLVSLRLLFHADGYPPEMRPPDGVWEEVDCRWNGISILKSAEYVRSEMKRSKAKFSLSSEYAERSGASWIIYAGSLELDFRSLSAEVDDPANSRLSSIAHYFDLARLPGSPLLTLA